jgi:broad specificity phosphatase PhoE
MRLYIIRHADPDYPNNTITEYGRQEAKALASRLASEGLTKIYSSPLGRALHTMQYTADRLSMPCEVLDWTRELQWRIPASGEDEHPYRMAWDVPGEILRGDMRFMDRDAWTDHPPFTDPAFHEEFEMLRKGSDALMKRHGYARNGRIYRVEASNHDRIAVFCHGGFGLTWLAHLLDLPVPMVWAGFWLPPSSVSTILFDERRAGAAAPRCIGLGDVSHLRMASLPVRPRGIIANFD